MTTHIDLHITTYKLWSQIIQKLWCQNIWKYGTYSQQHIKWGCHLIHSKAWSKLGLDQPANVVSAVCLQLDFPMGISICKSCKNVACIWIVILFILCDFFSCILGIDYQKWTNFGFEITRFIKTIMLSLQDPPIFDMYERKCIYMYIYKVFTLVKVPMYKHYDRINDSWLLTPDSNHIHV